jgi:protein-tyrosine-phosphatase
MVNENNEILLCLLFTFQHRYEKVNKLNSSSSCVLVCYLYVMNHLKRLAFIILSLAMLSTYGQFSATETLRQYCRTLEKEFSQINKERKKILEQVSKYITEKKKKNTPILLNFICTHNSRRSQFGQAWAAAAAIYFNVPKVSAFSGGTETTAANVRMLNALERAGFLVQRIDSSANPKYLLRLSESDEGQILFSKKFNDSSNPAKDFAAIMVCSQADEACPFVAGAEKRFSIPFSDPKIADNTPQETQTYDERCRQIAREIFYIFSKVK